MKTHIANDQKINIKTNANNLQHPTHLESFKKTKKNTHNRTAKKLPIKQNQNKTKTTSEKRDLVESRARTGMGGTIFIIKAFSRNFQAIGTLFPQQICETRRFATSTEGSDTPAELKLDDNCTAQSRGSLPFSCATLVCSRILSHILVCTDTAISRSCVGSETPKFRAENYRFTVRRPWPGLWSS